MRAVLQVVDRAEVTVDDRPVGAIKKGFLILLGVEDEDTEELTDKMMDKICKLRIFEDENGKTNLDLAAVGGEVLLVSQFTLASDCAHGHRPGFDRGMRSAEARPLYDLALEHLKTLLPGRVQSGAFGEDMKVSLVNDGPCTFMLDLPPAPFAQGRSMH